jgi:hypothetical protein
MVESIAERVARELHYDDPGNEWLNEQDNRKSAALWVKWATQRIQAAINEAVLHNFTTGELVEVAVRAEREAMRPLLEAGQMLRNAEMLSIEDIEEAEKKWDAAYIAAAIRARNVGAPTSKP